MSALAISPNRSLWLMQSRTAAAGGDADTLRKRQLAQVIEFPPRLRLLQELRALLSPGAAEDWYGPGASPTSQQAAQETTSFLTELPASSLDLEISPDQDGGITLDWYRCEDRQLSITFDGSGQLYYAAILGPIERVSGRLPFYGSVPEEALRVLQRMA